MNVMLFLLGAATGSFLNVVAARYQPDKFLLDRRVIGGRSRCLHCGKTLRWYELIPLVSFALQGGRCRRCRASLSFEYPLVELVSGVIAVTVPLQVKALGAVTLSPFVPALWITVFLTLLLIALVDLRLQLVPDEASVFLGVLGILLAALGAPLFAVPSHGSSLGAYALLFGFGGNVWVNRFAAAAIGALFFLMLVLLTRGKGMGVGDVKLAAALGMVFGWPDVGLLIFLGFIIGAAVGGIALLTRKKSLKSMLPFAPFLVLGAAVTFFFGFDLVCVYFSLFAG